MKNINKLLNSMTLREKIGQCVMIEPVFLLNRLNEENGNYSGLTDEKFLDKIINEYHIGFLLFGGVTRIKDDLPSDWASYLDTVNKYVNRNSKIPMLYGVDAVHGVNFVKGTTIFSHNLGVVSTWNPSLAEDYMDVVGKELETIGINLNFAPTIDISRDQRWGRVYESLGEDPLLASRFSFALVNGLQKNKRVGACAKHFVGYGESNYGFDRTPADISERVLNDIHIPPFKAAIEAGVKSIMVNGGDLNGIAVPASKKLLSQTLKGDLDFKGIVMSDWEDVSRLVTRHRIAKNKTEAIKRAFNAGLDMSMVVSDLETIDIMENLVNNNEIEMSRLNQAVTNILKVKLELGLFEKHEIDVDNVNQKIESSNSKQIAKKIAEESFVLLKNDSNRLPLSNSNQKILVTGKTANSKRHLCGGWTLNWASANEEDLDFKTITQALNDFSKEIQFTYASNINQLRELDLSTFDNIIAVVGEEPHSEWLGDSYSLEIESDEKEILQFLKDSKRDVIVVSLLARPQDVQWIDDFAKAILWAYTPGSEGAQAIVDTLFGKVSPSGKTPITFPKSSNQIPIYYNMRGYLSGEIISKYEPLYPFGYGLSYTTFKYSNLEVEESISTDEDLYVSIQVRNTGNYKSKEVVQLYITDLYASVSRPLSQLKDFQKIELSPNQSKQVKFKVAKEDLSFYDEFMNKVNEPRDIKVSVSDIDKVIHIK